MRPGALLAHLVRPQTRVLEDGIGVDDVHPDAVLPCLDRQDARQLRLGRLGGAVGAEVLAGGQHVLGGDEHQAAADPLFFHDPQGGARHQEVAGGVDVQRTTPVLQIHRVDGGGVGHPGVRDQDVQPAVLDHRLPEGRQDIGLVRDIESETDGPVQAMTLADLARHARRPLAVEIGDHDVAPLRRQPSGDGAADAVGRAGDQRHPALQLPARVGQRELVQLHRPVLDVERVLDVQGTVLADPLRRPQHADGVVIDVGHDVRVPGVLPGREHPETRNQDDARQRIELRLLPRRVLLEIEVVPGRVGREPLGHSLLEGGEPFLGVQGRGEARVHEQRSRFRVQQVVRRRRSGQRQLRARFRAHELEDIVPVVVAQDDPLRRGAVGGGVPGLRRTSAQEPPQVRREARDDRATGLLRQGGPDRRPEHPLPLPAVARVLLGAGVHLDRGVV